jgi:hypothetical protein
MGKRLFITTVASEIILPRELNKNIFHRYSPTKDVEKYTEVDG